MEKTFTATQKYLIMSPRKIRLVTALIKKMKPVEAVEKLPFVQKRSGLEIAKVIKNALASARNAGITDTDLVFKEIQVNEGPRLKRGRAASRGRWHPFKRRMSHIRIVLTTVEKSRVQKSKEPKKAERIEAGKVEEKKEKKKNGTKS
ncbi:MAG: 50S ribosomal protein L22 [Candidatus Woesebacteria bacterium GW2011_GWB1_45_5]|uniref:50S ribosomal protein L22 n=1 Tax=Candidatus Woesebacteria bacterium GW2011_GWB1_45_5 TaxID=1618581 RepID=A0A0G1MLV6_9BACT|nr:MAG: 50S ribosomal protein L22 [Candidatus Woesebacteria bacterium GW2011_GWB1_45_5]